MATIKTSCFTCGDVELRAPQMSLWIYENALERSYYSFSCTTCGDLVAKGADEECRNLLLTAEKTGLQVHRIVIPAEALEEHVGWLLTHDDILDFSLSLREVDLPVALLIEEHRLRPTA